MANVDLKKSSAVLGLAVLADILSLVFWWFGVDFGLIHRGDKATISSPVQMQGASPVRSSAVVVTVTGQVWNPGDIGSEQPRLSAVLARCVPNARANLARVKVTRRAADGSFELPDIDAIALLSGDAAGVALRDKDVVFVPERIL